MMCFTCPRVPSPVPGEEGPVGSVGGVFEVVEFPPQETTKRRIDDNKTT
jgi:hypothetical protein